MIEVGAKSTSCERSLKLAVDRLAAWFPRDIDCIVESRGILDCSVLRESESRPKVNDPSRIAGSSKAMELSLPDSKSKH